MKNTALAIALCALCAAMGGSADRVCAGPGSGGAGAPVFQISDTEYDLGIRLGNELISQTFEFSNGGEESLTVTVESKSCDCISNLVSGSSLAAGETGSISIGYDPTRRGEGNLGPRSADVTLRTNDPERPVVTLRIKFILSKEVIAQPASLDFGLVEPGHSYSRKFEVHCIGESKVPRITSIKAEHPWVELMKISEEATRTRRRTLYRVGLEPGDALGEFRTMIVMHTDSPQVPVIEVLIRASISSKVEATPSAVSFGIVRSPLEAVTRKVRLKARIGQSIRVAGAMSSDPRIKLKLIDGRDGRHWDLEVSFSAQGRSGRVKATISIFDENKVEVATIPVFAVVAPAN